MDPYSELIELVQTHKELVSMVSKIQSLIRRMFRSEWSIKLSRDIYFLMRDNMDRKDFIFFYTCLSGKMHLCMSIDNIILHYYFDGVNHESPKIYGINEHVEELISSLYDLNRYFIPILGKLPLIGGKSARN